MEPLLVLVLVWVAISTTKNNLWHGHFIRIKYKKKLSFFGEAAFFI